ncbi:MAG: type II toxin-antitoxin system VapC family toxin [SAR324 cluster bacterium]|nr:type II toxin-antitoxin system VapC family toxin [SAR324 cluster bacterium]
MLLDSNIIIYASLPEYTELRQFIAQHSPKISEISHLEVLGYDQLTSQEQKYFEQFFEAASTLPISGDIIQQAILLRQQKKMSLGDSIIAATSIEYNLKLVTRNTKDFDWISILELINPIDEDLPNSS